MEGKVLWETTELTTEWPLGGLGAAIFGSDQVTIRGGSQAPGLSPGMFWTELPAQPTSFSPGLQARLCLHLFELRI